jgi:triosephosphate isomerase
MLKDWGCQYVLVGHSERRSLYGETSDEVAKKFWLAAASGITPILCVGETLAEREQGQTLAVIKEQLAAVLRLKDNPSTGSVMVAYEPVWAIGTGRVALAQEAQEVHACIRSFLRQEGACEGAILYGGSVKPDNASQLARMPDIDGFLVGGASLEAQQFLEIGRLCRQY